MNFDNFPKYTLSKLDFFSASVTADLVAGYDYLSVDVFYFINEFAISRDV